MTFKILANNTLALITKETIHYAKSENNCAFSKVF